MLVVEVELDVLLVQQGVERLVLELRRQRRRRRRRRRQRTGLAAQRHTLGARVADVHQQLQPQKRSFIDGD